VKCTPRILTTFLIIKLHETAWSCCRVEEQLPNSIISDLSWLILHETAWSCCRVEEQLPISIISDLSWLIFRPEQIP